jgi:enoyl-CoA hydratase/carnithine racemase
MKFGMSFAHRQYGTSTQNESYFMDSQIGLSQLKCIKVSLQGTVALIELHRPEALNALNSELTQELHRALQEIDKSSEYRAAVLTGNEKSFAGKAKQRSLISKAGADIAEMEPRTFSECYNHDYLASWHQMFKDFRKPIIAAVNGFAVLE